MIQIKRGKTKSWQGANTILAPGQPGYDKDKHKIKIGDGEKTWSTLPYASGLSAEEILSSEKDAKKIFDPSDDFSKAIITYGTEAPNEDTVGQLYLQHYETEPETDYVVSYGINKGWTYQKWYSGLARCWYSLTLPVSVQTAFEGLSLYHDDKAMKAILYPFTFITKIEGESSEVLPSEIATLQSPGGVAWLACRQKNTENKSGIYTIISPDKQTNALYTISIQVEGYWR